MFIIIGISSIITSIFLVYYYFAIRDNKQRYVDESSAYPMWHWKFLRIYWISIVLAIAFFFGTLGIAAILISI